MKLHMWGLGDRIILGKIRFGWKVATCREMAQWAVWWDVDTW